MQIRVVLDDKSFVCMCQHQVSKKFGYTGKEATIQH